MKIVSVPIEYSSPLVNKYLSSFSEVGYLFEHDPGQEASFADRHSIIMRDYRTDRKKLVRILTEYNEKLHCGPKTLENIKKLADNQTTVVITGQQAGVLTGPLYTIYKTVTAIQLAGEITRKTGKQVIPVFWAASEDHDYAEINHMYLVNNRQELIRLTLDYEPAGKFSVGDIPVTEAVFQLIEQLESETNPSEWKNSIVNKLRELAGESGNLADWFAAIMSWLFQNHGLVMINPLNRELRHLWSGAFETFLRAADAVSERLLAGMERVRELGIKPQVETAAGSVNMFVYLDGERLPLLKSGAGFVVRGRDSRWSLDEITSIARNNPEMLSPNVVLRPVAQDILLPIMAYIAGPGEISYYAQYREIYPVFNQSMPIIYPRANVTLVERGIAKHMDKYGISFDSGVAGLKQLLDNYLEAQDQLGIDRLFNDFAEGLSQSFGELVSKVAAIDPELTGHGSESLHKMLHQVDYLEKKVHQYHRKSCETVIKRFHNIQNNLYPRQNWQERVLNIFPYLFKYGCGLVDTVTNQPLIGGTRHKLVYLGT